MEHKQFCEFLKTHFPEAEVCLWHTGGGIMNPVLVLEREQVEDEPGEPLRYVMFSDGWDESEASFSVCDREHDDSDPRAVFFADGADVPTDPDAIATLIRVKLVEAFGETDQTAWTGKWCYHCQLHEIQTPAEVEAFWIDADGTASGSQVDICRSCLKAGSPNGPGYREAITGLYRCMNCGGENLKLTHLKDSRPRCPQCDSPRLVTIPAASIEKVYRGKRHGPCGEVEVWVEWDGKRLGPLQHRVHHSPTGFEWGYYGSGPADLARSICWDVLGEQPIPRVYQRVKDRHVAGFGDEWTLTERQVRETIAELF